MPPIDPKDGEGSPTNEQAADPIHNLKSEMNRKLEKQEKAIADLLAANQQLLQKLTPQPPKTEEKKRKISDVWYDNPEAAADEIEERAVKKAADYFEQRQSKAQEHNATLSKLYNDYPELADLNNPLTQKANEIFAQLPESERKSPLAMRAAVREAAAEMGVAPASKRKQGDDDFVMGSGNGSSSSGRSRSKKEADVDPRTLQFAEIMGMDVSDPKVVERLKKQSRKDWGKYR